MAQFILVPTNQAENFTGNAKRNGRVLQWKAIRPIPIISPNNKMILPAEILDDEDIKEAYPALDALPQENENEIEFMEYEL